MPILFPLHLKAAMDQNQLQAIPPLCINKHDHDERNPNYILKNSLAKDPNSNDTLCCNSTIIINCKIPATILSIYLFSY